MGQELDCRMQYQRRTLTGKAYLETDYILFRGEERLKISIKDLQSVTAQDGLLHLDFPGGPAVSRTRRRRRKVGPQDPPPSFPRR